MPKKTKDKQVENLETTELKKSTTKISTIKKDNKKVVSKAVPKKEVSNKSVKKDTKKSTKNIEKTTKKSTSAKKTTIKTISAKKVTQKSFPATKKKNISVEYYDLPSHYEQTTVKILAQTPNILFVYWSISDKDIKKLLKQYGDNFFYETTPYLLVINKTKNYQFEVEINDYANSWYLQIPDSDCEYEVLLIRKSKNQYTENHTVSITSSNQIETPNDHILFEKLGKTIFFQNIKTQKVEEKDISSLYFMTNIGRIYNIYDLYKEIYKDELIGNELSSRLPSS